MARGVNNSSARMRSSRHNSDQPEVIIVVCVHIFVLSRVVLLTLSKRKRRFLTRHEVRLRSAESRSTSKFRNGCPAAKKKRVGCGDFWYYRSRRSTAVVARVMLHLSLSICCPRKVTEYFSYEHFYVVFCRFYELDADRDGRLSGEDLIKYGEHGLSRLIVDR